MMRSRMCLLLGGLVSMIAVLASNGCSSSDDSNGASSPSGDDGGSATNDGSTTGDGSSNTGDGGTTADGSVIPADAPMLPPDAGSTCTIYPADNPWNTNIADPAKFPADPNSSAIIAYLNSHVTTDGVAVSGSPPTKMHPDFGSDPSYGIPYIIVPGTQPKVACTFGYADQSDPGPYPIPLNAPIESGSDAHVLAVDKDNCKLYEMDGASAGASSWSANSGALFDLTSNALRPDQWTSADAAGLPIFVGLARLYEVQAGAIKHALRFTVGVTQKAFVHPATHGAGSTTDTSAPPMGTRFRLKASFDTSTFTGESKVIVTALQQYGMYVADNGTNWYISGETNTAWDDDDLNQLKNIDVNDTNFEVLSIGTPITQE